MAICTIPGSLSPTKLCEERDQVFPVHCCIPSPQHRTWQGRAQRSLVGDDCFLLQDHFITFMWAAGNVARLLDIHSNREELRNKDKGKGLRNKRF